MRIGCFYPVLALALLCVLCGCPALPPADSPVPIDALLDIADGSYGGMVSETLTLAATETASPLVVERTAYVIATVAAGRVNLIRFGTKPVGQFTSWPVEDGRTHETEQGLGGDSASVVRTFAGAGESVSRYTTQTELSDGQALSKGSGEGLLVLSVNGEGLMFDLQETAIYASGSVAGLMLKTISQGMLSKIADLPAPGLPGSMGSPGGQDPDPSIPPQAPGPAEKPADFANSGNEVLADGTSRTYSGNRQVATEPDTVVDPSGRTLSSSVDTLVRTFTAQDGTTSLETDTSKAYYAFGSDGKGRILGYQQNGQDRFIVDPADGVAGSVDKLEIGSIRSYTARFDDGSVDVFEETIVGTSQVILPSGVFDTFVSQSRLQRTHPDGTVETARLRSSIHPTLGLLHRYVEGTIVEPGGAVKTTVFEEYFDV